MKFQMKGRIRLIAPAPVLNVARKVNKRAVNGASMERGKRGGMERTARPPQDKRLRALGMQVTKISL